MSPKPSNRTRVMFAAVLLAMVFGGQPAYAQDRHSGYYYPEPQTVERYTGKIQRLPAVNRLSRIGFVTRMDQLQKKQPYAPTYHMFAKGNEAEKLIIVATERGRYDTIYRLRGLLASMTSGARLSPLFQKVGNVQYLNFLDLLKMAGFERLTITNGDEIAHQIEID